MTTVIVLGTTYSGSGAVFDYLKGRPDSYFPLGDAEYFLPQFPYGLMQLRSACSEAFHQTIAHEAFLRFADITNHLARPSQRGSYGAGYEKLLPGFTAEINALVHSLIDARMPMRFYWERMADKSLTEQLFYKINRKFKPPNQENPPERFLPVAPEQFTKRIAEMHDRLFRPPDSVSQFTLLNQAGSGWNPDQSTNFFSDRRVVVVSRDPRDQFVELKKFKGSRNVREFIKWFRNLQARTVTGIPEIMYLRFENFVFNHKPVKDSLLDFLGLTECESNYNPSGSEKYVGQYRRGLSSEEVNAIESELRDDYPECFYDS